MLRITHIHGVYMQCSLVLWLSPFSSSWLEIVRGEDEIKTHISNLFFIASVYIQ